MFKQCWQAILAVLILVSVMGLALNLYILTSKSFFEVSRYLSERFSYSGLLGQGAACLLVLVIAGVLLSMNGDDSTE